MRFIEIQENGDLNALDAVDSLLSDVSIFGYIYGLMLSENRVSAYIWLSSTYSDSRGSSGYLVSSPAKARLYKTRRRAEANRPIASSWKLFPVYGDPKIHGWAALSPFLSVGTIPSELIPAYGRYASGAYA